MLPIYRRPATYRAIAPALPVLDGSADFSTRYGPMCGVWLSLRPATAADPGAVLCWPEGAGDDELTVIPATGTANELLAGMVAAILHAGDSQA